LQLICTKIPIVSNESSPDNLAVWAALPFKRSNKMSLK
jgi:hypothetical protein